MENASGRATLVASLRSSFQALVLRPHHVVFNRPFALIFMLYGGTYLTANAIDTGSSTRHNKPASSITAGAAKFVASSTANVGLCIYKDQAFMRLFGPPGVAIRAVPAATYALFAARDCLTIFASFNVPPLLGPRLAEEFRTRQWNFFDGHTAAQFAAPVAVQLLSTPLHLLGLDKYNRPRELGPCGVVQAPGWRDRLFTVARGWPISTAARIARIVPAFGVGGVVNTRVRQALMTKLE